MIEYWCIVFIVLAIAKYSTSLLSSKLSLSSRSSTSLSFSTSLSPSSRIDEQVVSIGAAIAAAKNYNEILLSSSLLILPGEEYLPHHHQHYHQLKQKQHSVNALNRIIKFVIGSNNHQYQQRVLLNNDDRYYRIIQGAINSTTNIDINDFYISCDALLAIITLTTTDSNNTNRIITDLLILIDKLLLIMKTKFSDINPIYIDKLYWSISRLYKYHYNDNVNSNSNSNSIIKTYYDTINKQRHSLLLPFDVLHNVVNNITTYDNLYKEIQFQSEDLKTREGRSVKERRMTCWMAEKGIEGLAYSGKIMRPVPFCSSVTAVRDAIEAKTGIYYDCCLINLYPDGDSACKFHSDPDMGTYWSRDTTIISFGDVRRFHFRKIDDGENEQLHYTYRLYEGDVVYMFDSCQDDYQHAVMKGESENNNDGRISIVFKRAIPGPNGKKGHGLPKENQNSPKPKSPIVKRAILNPNPNKNNNKNNNKKNTKK